LQGISPDEDDDEEDIGIFNPKNWGMAKEAAPSSRCATAFPKFREKALAALPLLLTLVRAGRTENERPTSPPIMEPPNPPQEPPPFDPSSSKQPKAAKSAPTTAAAVNSILIIDATGMGGDRLGRLRELQGTIRRQIHHREEAACSREAVARTALSFDEMGTNRDGVLSCGEYASAMDRAAHLPEGAQGAFTGDRITSQLKQDLALVEHDLRALGEEASIEPLRARCPPPRNHD